MRTDGCEVLWSACLYAWLSTRVCQKSHVQTSPNFLYYLCRCSVLLWRQRNMLCTSGVENDDMLSHNRANVMYGTANGRRMSVSGRHRRQGRSFIMLAVHNGVWLWRGAMRCVYGGEVCYPRLPSFGNSGNVITLYECIGVSTARFWQHFDS